MLSLPESDSLFADLIEPLQEPRPTTTHQPDPHIMAALFTVHSFSGEPGDDVQPGEFLKTFCRFTTYAHITENSSIIESFGDHLKYGSPADEWFGKLNTTASMWKDVEKAFLERFPLVEKAKRTETELERELCELRLKVEDLGKKEKYAGEDVYTHVIFAEKALSLAKQAKIHTGSNSIWKVRDELPDIIWQKVKETYSSWTEFCAAIKGVEMAHIRDRVKKYQTEKDEKEKVEAAIAGLHRAQQQQQQQRRQPPPTVPLSPMSNANNAMQSMTIRNARAAPATTINATPHATTANTNPFTNSGGGQGNLFHRPPPTITNADRDALCQSLAFYPLQPNTLEGNRAWLAQLRDWRTKHGEGPITPATGFPLRPGGAAPGSGECFGCGFVGHRRDSGLCTTDTINPRERTFRTICGRILCTAPAAPVNFIEEAEGEFSWLSDHSLAHTVDQGNGEGPSA